MVCAQSALHELERVVGPRSFWRGLDDVQTPQGRQAQSASIDHAPKSYRTKDHRVI